jgi:1-acyl-sn-glycerol-3-phosphate acyltransferase
MLRGIAALLWFAVITLLLGVPAVVIQILRRNSDITMKAGRLWSRWMLRAVGARMEYEGLEHMRARTPCVFMANHQSNVDIWALVGILPTPTRFVAKQSLFRVPVMGWAMAAGGFVPIDRGNRSRAIRSLAVAAERIRAGRSVVLFPEGTRTRSGQLQPFKKGPFHLALQAGVPVIPVAIAGSYRVLPPGTLKISPGPVRVRFHPPIEIEGFLPDDHDGLLEQVHEQIRRSIEQPPDDRRLACGSEGVA